MSKITDYRTAYGSSAKDLDASVASLLNDGYLPWGSPFMSDRQIAKAADTFVIFQAMVKYAEPATAT